MQALGGLMGRTRATDWRDLVRSGLRVGRALLGRPDAESPWTVRLAWEHTHREMLSALLFMHHVERSGFRWSLEHVQELAATSPNPEILFVPFYYDDHDLKTYLFRGDWRGKWVVNLTFEQMHYACGRSYVMPDGDFARNEMLHCAWGDQYRNMLLEHGIAPERIRITGHPRFDIYSHPQLLFTRDELAQTYGLDPGRMWILVPHNFNLSYLPKQWIQRLNARGYLVSEELIEGVRDAREAFKAMIRELSGAFPEAELILRLHPAGVEDEPTGHKGSANNARVHAIAEQDIANWIRQAALTIVWNSTSSMEAMVAGRPVVSYEPFPFSERWGYDVNRILPTFSRLDDLFGVISKLPNPELTYDWELFESWYQYRDGRNFERVLDIAREAQTKPGSFASRSRGTGIKSVWRRMRQPLKVTHAPPQEPLAEAVRSLSSRPLAQFLR